MKAPVPMVAALEAAINRYLALDPRCLERLGALEGRLICLELRGLDVELYVLPGSRGVQLLSSYEGSADATLSGTPLALLRMGASTNAASLLFAGEVEIRGDTELGQRFKQILDDMEIDWEEHLAHVTGDVIAHQLGRTVRAAGDWLREAADSLSLDVAEYLQDEAQLLARRPEIERFVADVDVLRSDVDRLEARVRRLLQVEDPPG